MNRKNILITILFAGITLYGCVAGKMLTGKRSVMNYLQQNRVLGKGFTGLEVKDLLRGKVIMNVNGNRFFTPASNTKLFTFYTALNILGDSIPGIKYCFKDDSLFFTGYGDPTFLHPDFPDQPVYNFLKSTPDTLVYIPMLSDEKRFGPGWAWDDYPYDYSPEKSVLPVFGDEVWFEKSAGDSTASVLPPLFRDSVSIKTDSAKFTAAEPVGRDEFKNNFHIEIRKKDSLKAAVPFLYNKNLVLQILKDTLNRNIYISDTAGTCTWHTFYSQPLDSVMKKMLHKSDNFIAEQTLLICSGLLNDTASTSRMIGYAIDSIMPGFKDSMVWVDGSGLSRYNQQTPDNLVRLLERMYREIPLKRLFTLLPGYGSDLSKQLPGDDPSVYIYAKSGSMTHVYNLSGFLITRKGNILVFSFMNNDFRGAVPAARRESQRILQWLREKY